MEPEKTIQEKLQAAAPQLNWDRERVWAGLEINTRVKKKPVMWYWWASAAVTVSVVFLTLLFSADKGEQYAVRGKRGTESGKREAGNGKREAGNGKRDAEYGKRETEIGKRGSENGERKEGIADSGKSNSGTYKIKLSRPEKIKVITEVGEEMVQVDPAPELSEVEPLIVENVVNDTQEPARKVKRKLPRIQAVIGVVKESEAQYAEKRKNKFQYRFQLNSEQPGNVLASNTSLFNSITK